MKETLYETLGVSKNATSEEIKKVYREKAKKSHPDKKGGDKDKFSEVNKAHMALSDPLKREKYDKTGATEETPLETRIMGVIDMVFLNATSQVKHPERTDLIQKMQDELSGKKEGSRNSIQEGYKANKKLKVISERIKVKSGENILSMKLDNQIENNSEQIKRLEQEIDLFIQAEGWLDNYQYECDEEVYVQRSFVIDHGTISTRSGFF